MYARYVKRPLDFLLSLLALLVLSPILLVLTAIGAAVMGGNPFFTQRRPGKNAHIFRLIKFRSMTMKRDQAGNLLSDDMRLTAYGRLLRSTSLDELPELINILKGDMAVVGPRPLLEEYLPLYNESQRHRHDVRPGLTGLAQINGRNALCWEDKFRYDVTYAEHITFWGDVCIILKTVLAVLKRSDISSDTSVTMEPFHGNSAEEEHSCENK